MFIMSNTILLSLHCGCCHKAPIYWFLVSHQGLPLHTMRAGITIIQPTDISRKKLTSVMARLSSLIIRHCTRVILDAVHWTETFVSVTFIAIPWRLSLVCLTKLICANKNHGDKFYGRKSMQVVDEKLIINELGPNAFIFISMKKILIRRRQSWNSTAKGSGTEDVSLSH